MIRGLLLPAPAAVGSLRSASIERAAATILFEASLSTIMSPEDASEHRDKAERLVRPGLALD
jgi:hypothetical protein